MKTTDPTQNLIVALINAIREREGSPTKTKLLKFLYLADLASYRATGKTATGFDWIFSRKIAGLITMFGGANSHMAIRCAEFSIPAAIGCGSVLYEATRSAGSVELDCAGAVLRFGV